MTCRRRLPVLDDVADVRDSGVLLGGTQYVVLSGTSRVGFFGLSRLVHHGRRMLIPCVEFLLPSTAVGERMHG